VISAVERIEPKRIHGKGGPKAQRIDVPAAPSDDWNVIRNRFDGLGGMPDGARCADRPCRRFDAAPKPMS